MGGQSSLCVSPWEGGEVCVVSVSLQCPSECDLCARLFCNGQTYGCSAAQTLPQEKRPAALRDLVCCLEIGRWCPRCSHFDWRSSASWGATVPHSKIRQGSHRRRARRRPRPRRRRRAHRRFRCIRPARTRATMHPTRIATTAAPAQLVLTASTAPIASTAVRASRRRHIRRVHRHALPPCPRRRRRAPRRRRRNTHPSLLAGRQRRRHRRCRYATARNARLALSLEHPCRQLCNAAASVWSTPPSAPATSPKQALVHFARISPRGSCAVAVSNAAPTRMLITAPSKALRASTSISASLA
jgi:hypothetical protein